MISAGAGRDFEFIYEADGHPRNEAADKLGGIPADSPDTYYVRHHLRRHGPVGVLLVRRQHVPARRPARAAEHVHRPEDRAGRAVRPRADRADGALRLDPLRPGRHGRRRHQASSTTSTAPRSARRGRVVRAGPGLLVSGGTLQIPAAPGDIYQTRNDAKNLSCATGSGRAVGGDREAQLQGHRPVPPGRHHGLRRRRELHEVRRIAHTARGRREVRVHQRGELASPATRPRTRRRTSRRTSRTTSGSG